MMDDLWAVWVRDWTSALEGVARMDAPAFATQLEIAPASSSSDLAELDLRGIHLPQSMLDVVASRSARVGLHWRLFDYEGFDSIESPALGQNTPWWGGRHAADVSASLWDVSALPRLKQTYQEWLDVCFLPWIEDEPDDPYPRVWLDKLPIIEVADGDMIAIDILPGAGCGQIVYLCHDDACDLHGQALGSDFVDFVTRWSRVGCVGPDGPSLGVFSEAGVFAAPDSQTVLDWRSWLGMSGEPSLGV